jgi:D-alanyl-D-alanine carboxypeptidase
MLVMTLEDGALLLGDRGKPWCRFEIRETGIVGTSGYLAGETLHVVRREDGSVSHLECATFVLTREPYDPEAPIAGPR